MVDYAGMSRNVRAFMSLFHCTKPVICKVHGFCVAGGTDLALCSDLLVIAGLGAPAWDITAAGDGPTNLPLWGGMGAAAMMEEGGWTSVDVTGLADGGGGLDVMVTDGFTGNVVLKTAEGAGRFLAEFLRMQVKRSLLAQLGALLMRPVLRGLKQVVDVDGRGGAPLLGVDGVAIICHGRSSARAIARAIAVAEEHVAAGLAPALQQAIVAHRSLGPGGGAASPPANPSAESE